jgi:hypothetical protein
MENSIATLQVGSKVRHPETRRGPKKGQPRISTIKRLCAPMDRELVWVEVTGTGVIRVDSILEVLA